MQKGNVIIVCFVSFSLRTRVCLADFRELMLDFGLIDEDDPSNVKFYMDIAESLVDPEERLVIG